MVNFWREKSFIASIVVFLTAFGLLSLFYLNTPGTLGIGDQYFHYGFAEMVKKKGFSAADSFDHIYLSPVAKEDKTRQIELFNVALIPFTFFENSLLGLKLSVIFWASTVIGILYYVLRKSKVPYASLFTLIFLMSFFPIFRLLIGRGLVLVFGLLLLEILLVSKKKYSAFFFVAFFHVLWHQSSFFMIPFIAVAGEVLRYITHKEFSKKMIFLSILAVILGMAPQPNFPQNIVDRTSSLVNLQSEVVQESDIARVEGQELHTLEPSKLINYFPYLLLLNILAYSFVIYSYIKNKESGRFKNEDHLFYLVFLINLASLFGVMVISGRFVDFFIITGILLSALCVKRIFRDTGKCFDSKMRKFVIAGVYIAVIFFVVNTLIDARVDSAKTELETKKAAAQWVFNNSDQGDKVFLEGWSQFPIQFFYNKKVKYSMGMEPMTLKKYDENLFWKWYNMHINNIYCQEPKNCTQKTDQINSDMRDMTNEEKNAFRKENSQKMIQSIVNDFQADFVFSKNKTFNKTMLLNEDMFENHQIFETRRGSQFFVGKIRD